jgi:hypothetical protein
MKPGVRDESHLDDMRNAIRGDFERLARRRGNQELMRLEDDPSEAVDSAGTPEPPEPEPPLTVTPTHEITGALTLPEIPQQEPSASDPSAELEPAPDPVLEVVSDVEAPTKHRSWLDRLLGRD